MSASLLSNFPGGFANGVTIRGVPILNAHAGKVFWVSSATGADGNKGTSPERPLATLDYAIGKCTANAGDVIMVMPNHAETITGVGGITADVAGITIVGMGTYNQRPRFLMDGGTTVDFVVSAADVTVQNCVFAAGHADIVRCFNVTAAGFASIDNEFVNNVVDENFLTPIKCTSTTDNNADGLKVIGNKFMTVDASTLEFIEINANLQGLVCYNNFVCVEGTASPLILVATGKLLQQADIGWNRVAHKMTANELFISNDGTTNTGVLHNNYVGHADVTTTHDAGWDGGGFRLFNNQSTSVDNLQGLLIPVADANS